MNKCCQEVLDEAEIIIDKWRENARWHIFDVDVKKLKLDLAVLRESMLRQSNREAKE